MDRPERIRPETNLHGADGMMEEFIKNSLIN
jgi:hypothetical protein